MYFFNAYDFFIKLSKIKDWLYLNEKNVYGHSIKNGTPIL